VSEVTGPDASGRAFATLRGFAQRKQPVERCDLCGQQVAPEHDHLIDPSTNKLSCACQPCAILFASGKSAGFKRVPRRVRFLKDFRLSDAQWDSLRLPIDLAFIFYSSVETRTRALYPGPAGVTESLLELDTWGGIVRENPVLAEMEPDVEALLVNRARRALPDGQPKHFLVPIDECYKLVGLIRTNWRGLGGGTEVWGAIAGFFADLERRQQGHRA
jgi:hypothetical protein